MFSDQMSHIVLLLRQQCNGVVRCRRCVSDLRRLPA